MKQVRSKTREEWVKSVLGPRRRLTQRQMRRVLHEQAFKGWITAMSAEGPAYEQIAMVREDHPLAFVVQEYRQGKRWFAIDAIEYALGAAIDSRAGAQRLAKAGFAMVSGTGDTVQLRATDPKTARFVNEARCCSQVLGYCLRGVLEAFLSLRRPRTRGVNITEERRLKLVEVLQHEWSISCEDALNGRLRVRLISIWTFTIAA